MTDDVLPDFGRSDDMVLPAFERRAIEEPRQDTSFWLVGLDRLRRKSEMSLPTTQAQQMLSARNVDADSEVDRIRREAAERVRQIEEENARQLEADRQRFEKDRLENQARIERMDAVIKKNQEESDRLLYGSQFNKSEADATHDALMALPPPGEPFVPHDRPMNYNGLRRSENVIDKRGYRGMRDRALLAIQQRADEVTVAAAEREGQPADPIVQLRDLRRRQLDSARDNASREASIDRQIEEINKRLDDILGRRDD